MLTGAFFAFHAVKSDCFCKFARLYDDEQNFHIHIRGAGAAGRMLRRGGHPAHAEDEDRLIPDRHQLAQASGL